MLEAEGSLEDLQTTRKSGRKLQDTLDNHEQIKTKIRQPKRRQSRAEAIPQAEEMYLLRRK